MSPTQTLSLVKFLLQNPNLLVKFLLHLLKKTTIRSLKLIAVIAILQELHARLIRKNVKNCIRAERSSIYAWMPEFVRTLHTLHQFLFSSGREWNNLFPKWLEAEGAETKTIWTPLLYDNYILTKDPKLVKYCLRDRIDIYEKGPVMHEIMVFWFLL